MKRRLGVLSWAALVGACGFGTDSSDLPPTISVVAPAPGDVVSGSVEIRVEAFDRDGVKEVRFFVDNVALSTDALAPFIGTWDTRAVTDGPHAIRVEAEDTKGNDSSVSFQVTVENTQT